MYFKQIEITGFKSFADRTAISVEGGMTAIVGPNGCGKSNILDALRWALGEQSAKALRGSHMQDVIFNGSEDRAATGMAEVTLTFDNADSALPLDFAEVQITRRIYRSGESEYLINKAPCRLKDVHELFMDTGIGTNAYSMIGQGKIGLVLSSRPEDRRFLFEEAAGIVKYKSRKKVAMRRLDQAEQNLLRLGDIIAEVQRQMRSLKRQVNAAIRYRELTDQLKELEIRAAWLSHSRLSESVEVMRKEFESTQNAYEKDSAELSQIEARYEELNLNKFEVDRVLHARREGVHEIDAEMEKMERQIALIRQQMTFSHEQEERAGQEHDAFNERAAAIAKLCEETSAKAAALRAELEEAERVLQAKQDDHEQAVGRVSEADEQLEAARARAVGAMNVRAKTQTTVETLGVSIDNIEGQLKAIYERQEGDSQRNAELVKILDETRRAETEKQGALAETEDRRKKAAEEEAALAKDIGEANEKWQGLRETKSSAEARLASLRELRDSYEGFAQGVRAVMKGKKDKESWAKDVIGPAGDLVATEKDYEQAIEAALGGNINNVIVEDADAAKGAVRFLTDRKAGRVTFLPLDLLRPRDRDDFEAVKGLPGVLGKAIDYVQFDDHVRPAMDYLFSNTVLVESIDDAIRIARSGGRFPRLVTVAGDVISPSGAVTGGRTGKGHRGLLGRSSEITELEERVRGLDEEIDVLSKRGRELARALEALQAASAKLVLEEEGLQSALNELGVAIARHSAELSNLAEAGEALNTERTALCDRRDTLEAERRTAMEQAAAMESEGESLDRAIVEAQEGASRTREELSILAGALSDLRVNLTQVRQTLQEAERDGQRQEREHANALAEAERRVQSVEEFKANQVSLEGEIKDLVERSKAFSETKEEARKKVVEAENQRQALLDESETLEGRLKEVRNRSRETQAAMHKLEIDLRHNEDQIAFFQERILTEYQVALGTLAAEEVGTDDLADEEREKIVRETRTRLERMGTVNLMAIEEYEALTERNEFLVSQEADLNQAREALLSVVARIDTTIKDMFLDTFMAVSEHFRQFFRRLFNGGQARIYLLDEDDPLESGIEIEARPPGKKPQSISLLSGGEQALTAIGLLFSLFKARPSPFCVLDEVDAPLDDANIGRFLSVIDEFVEMTQFIIITHNKQTMARADAIYGVTMQERGVSKLVSVRFDEVREEAEPAA